MYNLPDIGSGQHPVGFSGSTARRDINSYEGMDAGLTIKTREGDIVTLSTSRYSELNAHEYSSQGYLTTENGQAMAMTHERSIELSTGETFSFSVQGDLNEQELADIESIVSGIDGIIYQMADGNMDEAVAQAMSMGAYASVSSYEADITVARSYTDYAETTRTDMGTALPSSGDGSGWGNLLPDTTTSPFMNEISKLLEEQDAAALAHARQPLSHLFDQYLDTLPDLLETGTDSEKAPAASSELAAAQETAAKSPTALALESTAKMVDQLIQDMVRDAFENSLDQVI